MSFKIKLKNNSFFADPNKSIFESAKEKGITLEHSCLTARCRSCIARKLDGSITRILRDDILTDNEIRDGFILTCNSLPNSNMSLDISGLNSKYFHEIKTTPTKIHNLKFINRSLLELTLRFPPKTILNFNPGQYFEITYGKISRSYSITQGSIKENKLIFYIRNYPGGEMSNYLFNTARINDLLRVRGPFGTFRFNDNSLNNIIFLATGTGIAPVKSILEAIDQKYIDYFHKTIWLFWGNRYDEDFNWSPNFNNIDVKFKKVLSKSLKDWEGPIGYVQNEVIKSSINLNESSVYACGSEKMINDSRKLLMSNGLNINEFYSDVFVKSEKI